MELAQSFTGKKVLVTGSTGFVGSHLTVRLLEQQNIVTLLARSTSNNEQLKKFIQLGAKVITGDLTNRESVFQAAQNQEYIFHVGALYREAKFPDQVYFDVNLEGTRHVFDAAKEHSIKRVIHTSTTGVHSHIENPPADESYPYHPTDVYQISKTEAEKLAKERIAGGQDITVLRPAMIWGQGDRRILKLFRGIYQRKLPIIGTGKSWTHWIYVQDLVTSYLLAALTPQAKGQIYLIAGNDPLPLDQVYQAISRVSGVPLLPYRIPAFPIQLVGSCVELLCRPFGIEPPIHRRRVDFFVKNRAFNTSKARTELGFKSTHSFEEEVQIIFNWYKNQQWLT
ncbi:NAD-dependent epimerase/dehydratase family protein [bacterium]|nr:NAD-dependent epimerase/dehydratase family protein [bacterium]